MSLLAVAAATGAILTPVPAAADPPQAQVLGPAPLKPQPRRSKTLLKVGLSTFLGGYVPLAAMGIGALAAKEEGRQRWGWGLLPIAGPWIAMAQPQPEGRGDPGGGPAVLVVYGFIGLLGISQGVGAVALTAFAVPPEADDEPEPAAGVRIQPVIGFGTAGVIGTF